MRITRNRITKHARPGRSREQRSGPADPLGAGRHLVVFLSLSLQTVTAFFRCLFLGTTRCRVQVWAPRQLTEPFPSGPQPRLAERRGAAVRHHNVLSDDRRDSAIFPVVGFATTPRGVNVSAPRSLFCWLISRGRWNLRVVLLMPYSLSPFTCTGQEAPTLYTPSGSLLPSG